MDPGYQPELGKGKGTAKGEIPNFSKTILQRQSVLVPAAAMTNHQK